MYPSSQHRQPARFLTFLSACLLCASASQSQGRQRFSGPTQAAFVPTFSTNARVKQQVERLGRIKEQKLWDQWITLYQQLVDDPGDVVMARDEEFLVGLRYFCHQQLAALPAAVRQRYRAVHDPEAGKLYDKAAAERDPAAMRDLYSRFRFSSFGPKALLWLADRALDQGQPELARVSYSRLAKEPDASPTTLLRYALAADAAGKSAEAKEALDRVRTRFAGQQVTLAGEKTTGAAAADQMAKAMQARKPLPAGAWTAYAGTSGDRKMPSGPDGTLQRLWTFTQPTAPAAPSTNYQYGRFVEASYSASRGRFQFLTFPTVVGDRVWVEGPRNVTQVNLATGKPVWDQQDFTLSREEVPSDNPNPRTGGMYYASGRPVQVAPSVDGHLIASRVPLAAVERDSSRWPIDLAITVMDNRTGQQLWRRIAGGDPRGYYWNVPTLQSNLVLTGIATFKGGITEYTAQALDAGTGEPVWTTYLGAGSDPLGQLDGSPAAVRDGIVWIESTLYTLNALDLVTGEVRLIYHYEPGTRMTARGGMDSSPVVANEPISLIATSPGPVLFCPRWGLDVVAIDPANGRLLWSSPKAPGNANTTRIGVLFGADEKHAYVCGEVLRAINLADGSPDWTWEPPPTGGSQVEGYAALAGDRIYFPVDAKIQVISTAKGQAVGAVDVADVAGENPTLATVVVAGDRLLYANRDKVAAYGLK